jgi:pyruvate dehydrogenase E1 component alpha subunit
MTIDPADVTRPAMDMTIDAADVARLLREMTRIRRFEERCVELYSAAEIRGFMHLYIGEEAIAVGVMSTLAADDAVVATYRDHGHALARGIDPSSLMAEMMGRASGVCHGRGGSMHIFDAATRFYGGNGIVGGGLPLAGGLALADRMLGRPGVTACFFGEGAVAEGEFHETMNLASLWKLPVLFCCENNFYAMGTAIERSESETNIAVKASAYEMPAWTVDGMDVIAVERAARRAVTAIRAGGGPVFLELQTYRFRAHSMYDPERYRSKDEVDRWKQRDPLVVLTQAVHGLIDDDVIAGIEADVAAEIDHAVDVARLGALESIDDLTRHVYSAGGGA